MDKIKEIAYQKYKLDWMISHGMTLDDLLQQLNDYRNESDYGKEQDFLTLLREWEYERGFGGELYVCFNEFLETEFLDKDYMLDLLSDKEYCDYINVIKNNVA